MIRITKRCVTFNIYARNFNFHNEMKATIKLSNSHDALCLPFLHETHEASIYMVSQEERTKLRKGVPYVKLYRYNPKHLYPKLNGYGDNGKRSLKL